MRQGKEIILFKIIALITEKDSMEILRTISLVGIVLLFVACKDAKIKVTSKSSSKISNFATGANPINAQTAGASSQISTPDNYKVILKVSSMPINHTTPSGYKFQGKVVIQ